MSDGACARGRFRTVRNGAAEGARPLLSIIVPHLEDCDGLSRCLAALSRQERAPCHEVIVVDNGSSKPPGQICRRFDARLLFEPRPGPGPARNAGAASARAPFLAFVDADCAPAPDWMATLAAALGAQPAAVVAGHVRVVSGPDTPPAVAAYEALYSYRCEMFAIRHNYAASCNMGVARDTFHAVGPFAGIGRAEDVDWGRRAWARGHCIVFVPGASVETPARTSFRELERKWRRHIAHEWLDAVGPARSGWRWVAKAALLAVSPVGEALRIAVSRDADGLRQRAWALVGLTRVRLMRARYMMRLAGGLDCRAALVAWNANAAGEAYPGDSCPGSTTTPALPTMRGRRDSAGAVEGRAAPLRANEPDGCLA